jgi:Flp pilus assembly pilin Flp
MQYSPIKNAFFNCKKPKILLISQTMALFKGVVRQASGQAVTEYLILAAAVSAGMLGVSLLFAHQVQQYLSFIYDLLSKPF